MKKGEEYIGPVERIDFPNKGIVAVGEEHVVVKDALPGQRVRFRVAKLRHGKVEGTLLDVVEPSPLEEKELACVHAGRCGGCLYQTFPYEEQQKQKEAQVLALLAPAIARQERKPEYVGFLPSPKSLAYRNKMEFSFGDEVKGGELTLGLHKKGSFYDIVETVGCTLVHEDYSRILECVLSYCRERGFSYYHKMTHVGYLRHLLVRRAEKTGEILVNLVTTSQREEDLAPLAVRLLALPLEGTFAGILHSVNDSLADVVKAERTRVLYGRDCFYEELLGLRFRISTFSFFQTNSLGAEVLYRTARDFLGTEARSVVYDLYSGTGTIAQLLAPAAKKVVGVEIVEEAVEAARQNALENGLTNCEFLAGDVLKVLDCLTERPDVIVLDPPRDGVHPAALRKIAAYGAEKLLYISCKPTSLARDLEGLWEDGYRMEKFAVVDMFPQTGNVESIALLERVSS